MDTAGVECVRVEGHCDESVNVDWGRRRKYGRYFERKRYFEKSAASRKKLL